jgi:hypothetical protein
MLGLAVGSHKGKRSPGAAEPRAVSCRVAPYAPARGSASVTVVVSAPVRVATRPP